MTAGGVTAGVVTAGVVTAGRLATGVVVGAGTLSELTVCTEAGFVTLGSTWLTIGAGEVRRFPCGPSAGRARTVEDPADVDPTKLASR